MKEYVHPQPGLEIEAVGGHYVLTREARIEIGDRTVLYFVGYGVFDTTCCGAGGCGYALVPGELIDYAHRRTVDGRPVSRVIPIDDPALQALVRQRIMATEYVSQVLFEA